MEAPSDATAKRKDRTKAISKRERHESTKHPEERYGRQPIDATKMPRKRPLVVTTKNPDSKKGGADYVREVITEADQIPADWNLYLAQKHGPGRYRVEDAAQNYARFIVTDWDVERARANPPTRGAPSAPPPITVVAPPTAGTDAIVAAIRELGSKIDEIAPDDGDDGDDEPRKNPADIEAIVRVAVQDALAQSAPKTPSLDFEAIGKMVLGFAQRAPTPPPAPPQQNPPDPERAKWDLVIPLLREAGYTPEQIAQDVRAHAQQMRAATAPETGDAPSSGPAAQ